MNASYNSWSSTPINNSIHQQTRFDYTYTLCSLCNSEVPGTRNETQTLSMTKGHSYDATGKCEECGHTNSCTHSNVGTVPISIDPHDYTPVSSTEHSYKCDVEESLYCWDCDIYLSDKTLVEKDATKTGGHAWTIANATSICSLCQYTCTHDETETDSRIDGVAVYVSTDDTTHTATGCFYDETWCTNCGATITTGESKSETRSEDHSYDENGVCTLCKHACTHPESAQIHQSFQSGNIIYTALDDKTHKNTTTEIQEVICSICNITLSTSDPEQYSYESSHSYGENNVCEDCGYVNACKHPEDQIISYSWVEGDTYEPVNSQIHRLTGDLIVEKYCNNCYMTLSQSVVQTNFSKLYYHSFDEDQRCTACGYTIACEHPEDKIAVVTFFKSPSDYVAVNVDTHEYTADYCEEKYCTVCSTTISITVLEETREVTESHNFNEGVCINCGYKTDCTHPKKKCSSSFFNNSNIYEPKNSTHHTGTGTRIKITWCNACSSMISDELVDNNYTFDEKHTFVEGVCKQCGYVNTCDHPANQRKTVQEVYRGEIISTTSREHTWSGVIQNNTVCSVCGECLDYKLVSNSTLTEKHTFKDGFCSICGVKKPVSSSDTNDDSEPVVTYTEIAATTVTHGVSAASPLRMAETLLTAAEHLALEIQGENFSITPMHADEILTDGEMVTFSELPVSEQVLVLLSAIGYQDEIDHYLTENELALSGDALALAASISDRVAAMTDEDRAAHTALVEEFFPVETITANGAECEFAVIELKITIDGVTHYERYGFCPDESNGWYFHSLSVSSEIAA